MAGKPSVRVGLFGASSIVAPSTALRQGEEFRILYRVGTASWPMAGFL